MHTAQDSFPKAAIFTWYVFSTDYTDHKDRSLVELSPSKKLWEMGVISG